MRQGIDFGRKPRRATLHKGSDRTFGVPECSLASGIVSRSMLARSGSAPAQEPVNLTKPLMVPHTGQVARRYAVSQNSDSTQNTITLSWTDRDPISPRESALDTYAALIA